MIVRLRCWRSASLLLVALGCAGRTQAGTEEAGTLPPRRAGDAALGFDASAFYRQAGLLAGDLPVGFVGTVHFLASATPDTSLVLVGVSLPSSSLTFVREDDRFRAGYEIRAELRRNGVPVDEVSAREQVRVGSFMETTRTDESVIFQEFIAVPPGRYELMLIVRDLESSRTSTSAAELTIPRYTAGFLSSPVPVHEVVPRTRLDSLPDLIASPRASAVFGRDSVISVYVEAYGTAAAASVDTTRRDTTRNDTARSDSAAAPAVMPAAPASVPIVVRIKGEGGRLLHEDSTTLRRTGALYSDTLALPVSRLGIGATTLSLVRTDSRDSSTTPLVVSFGDDLPLVTFDQMLDYLQYFGHTSRVRAIRDADPDSRQRLWGDFLRTTDPDPATPEHEGLRRYFDRIAYANLRFREEGSTGWRSDRGMVYVALGEPDQILEQTRSQFGGRGRVQVWEYRMHRLQLLFVDQTGFGRWRLSPSSEVEFRSALHRLQEP